MVVLIVYFGTFPFMVTLLCQLGSSVIESLKYGLILLDADLSFQAYLVLIFGYTYTLKSETLIVSGKSGCQ